MRTIVVGKGKRSWHICQIHASQKKWLRWNFDNGNADFKEISILLMKSLLLPVQDSIESSRVLLSY